MSDLGTATTTDTGSGIAALATLRRNLEHFDKVCKGNSLLPIHLRLLLDLKLSAHDKAPTNYLVYGSSATETTAHRAVRYLREAGFLETHHDTKDTRLRLVSLTEAGEAAVQGLTGGRDA